MVPRPLALMLASLFASQAILATPVSGIDFNHFDRSVRIQDDLFAAVNGRWLQTTTIPADQESYGVTDQLRALSEERSKYLIKQALTQPTGSADGQKIGNLYRSFMDDDTANRLGIQPLQPDLRRIAALDDRTSLTRYLGAQQSALLNLPLILGVASDSRDGSVNLPQVVQAGLGMPNRDFYLQPDPQFVTARQAYLLYLQTLLSQTGCTDPAARARAVLALETRLAQAQWSTLENRDPQKTYNRMNLSSLAQLTPGFDWRAFLAQAQLPSVTELNLMQPGYMRQLAILLQTLPLQDWRDYLTVRLLDGYAPYLHQALVNAHFAYHQQALSGTRALRPRWKRGVALVDSAMGNALGKLYVERYFPENIKTQVQQLVAHLLSAQRQSIDAQTWMSPATRAQAQNKLARYAVKIGYPDQWIDYSGLTIQADDLIGNLRQIKAFNYRYRLNKLSRPVDRGEWFMQPQTVNAYYSTHFNEIVFPAAMLQPPFFNPEADNAVNYGAIGSVIGHEISHGFDDKGSLFDGEGHLRDWWAAEDRARFRALTARLATQYAAYQPLPGRHINGELTLGEAIADNIGLALAYQAYQLSLNGQPAPVIDGLSGDQRFFIGFAQSRRGKLHDAQLLKMLVSSPHPPPRFRANGPAVNSDAFYQAFGVQPGDGMYRPTEQRIRLW